ncbi:calcium/sodium antiporter [Methylobacter sp. BlB1]|uniref:calcium/sodium antiporter n=1 Tax=Methylobacter sp. BlB1 TaxID=2785914 RepID=UPI001895883F|nr:calcium/sodium antiporter [Methylobacter sp. BlB1]MBF6648609.1 calcium/sodium antiporter [Methylobacter sp. BlB1]
MVINFIALLAGLAILVYSADKFVTGTASIARNLGVSPLLIGLTIVSVGTSAPEILVSTIASWQGNAGLAIGNALGSNIANIGLILGSTALVAPLAFHSGILKRELPVLMALSIGAYLLSLDGWDFFDGALMLVGLVTFTGWLIRTASNEKQRDPLGEEMEAELSENLPNKEAWLYFGFGLVGLLLSSRVLVMSAVNIAQFFGVSDVVIGLTIVAVGTSLPELAASIGSVLKGEDDLAVGNVVGSNIYNLLAVYSVPGVLAPGPVAESVLTRDFPVMLAFTGALFILGYGISKAGHISRMEGLGLVSVYTVYGWFLYQSAVAV